ncbi:uncharacterized protein with ParB-like and HNH nuclease domain [Rhodococcus sp. 27YEA15]|uniref:DUF262 domain-containing protein n=1 Tax=Rhodococcus sp. 27YEA15 TaxID=3156259 RepID=UPI003C7BE939
MKAVDAPLLDLLKKSTQFVVPIYQRRYSWQQAECERLWNDILHAGSTDTLVSHFAGSIVYVERDEGTKTSSEPDLIIDGQQRVTTVMILLAALATTLDNAPVGRNEPVEGFSPKKIRGRYLTNSDEDGERYYKLVLSKSDKGALKAILDGSSDPQGQSSRVLDNYNWFVSKLGSSDLDMTQICLGLKKLIVVDVKLTRGSDDPQLVFETMNSTGKKLSQADLIRNFVLMDLQPSEQSQLYERYWLPMERTFAGPDEGRFDEFVRHYLTLKTGAIPRLGDIYDAFKTYASDEAKIGTNRNQLVVDLHKHAMWFSAIALGTEADPKLAHAFQDLEQLKATVVYPFLLRVYSDYDAGCISSTEVEKILAIVTSYLFRRGVCQIPPNSHNKTFAVLGAAVDPTDYVNSVAARLLLAPTNARFPSDDEFRGSLTTSDLYHFKRAPYLLRKLENAGRKEEVRTADYTIEHIMPQNPNLSAEWRTTLGADWKIVQESYLHTLGNLTLTGYNPEYSDKPFSEKRDMEGGFRQSPLRLNHGLGQLEQWTATEILDRADRLTAKAMTIWTHPDIGTEALELYRKRFAERSGFDWSLLHSILALLPSGKWTSYYLLGEAIDTHAQPVANHLSRCTHCTNAHKVLTWDGKIAQGFRWVDPKDQRNPQALLEADGIAFTDGVADHDSMLVAEDLLALIGD